MSSDGTSHLEANLNHVSCPIFLSCIDIAAKSAPSLGRFVFIFTFLLVLYCVFTEINMRLTFMERDKAEWDIIVECRYLINLSKSCVCVCK